MTYPPLKPRTFTGDPIVDLYGLPFEKMAQELIHLAPNNPMAQARLRHLYPRIIPFMGPAVYQVIPVLREMARYGHYGAWHWLEIFARSGHAPSMEDSIPALATIKTRRPPFPAYLGYDSIPAVIDFLCQGTRSGDSAALAYLASLSTDLYPPTSYSPHIQQVARERLQHLDLTSYLTHSEVPLHALMQSATVGNNSACTVVQALSCSALHQQEALALLLGPHRRLLTRLASDYPWFTSVVQDLPMLVAERSLLSHEIIQDLSHAMDPHAPSPLARPFIEIIQPLWQRINLVPFMDNAPASDMALWGALGHPQALDRIGTWPAIPFEPGPIKVGKNIALAYHIAEASRWRPSPHQTEALGYLLARVGEKHSSALLACTRLSHRHPHLTDALNRLSPKTTLSFLGTGAIAPVLAQWKDGFAASTLGAYLDAPNPVQGLANREVIGARGFARVEHGVAGIRMGLGTFLYEGSMGQLLGRRVSTQDILIDTALMLGAGIVASVALKPLFARMLVTAASPLGHFAHTALTFGLHRLASSLMKGDLHLSWQNLGQAMVGITLGGGIESFAAARLGIAGVTFTEILKNSHTLSNVLGNSFGYLSRGTLASFFGNAGNDIAALGQAAHRLLTAPPGQPTPCSPRSPFPPSPWQGSEPLARVAEGLFRPFA